MADDVNASPRPPDSPNVQPAPSANVTPAAADGQPPRPRFSLAEAAKHYLRSALNILVGTAVGAAGGLLLHFVLSALGQWHGDWRIMVGAGLLVGLFFNHSIVRLLRLESPKERESAAAGKPSAEEPAPGPVRETVEMLVSVVILVVLLKSFDAEAYVIPTGSMSQTLLGDQKWVVCPSCGYRFPVDCSDEVDTMKARHATVTGCTCPNCRQHVELIPQTEWRDVSPPPIAAISNPECNGGDRILASKFQYDLFGAPPDRLDVVVFKFPGNDGFPPKDSFHDGVQINYIKRLVGLPRETIAIFGGDLYYLPADKGPQYDDFKDPELAKELAETPGVDPARRLWEPTFLHTDMVRDGGRTVRDQGYQIIRKSPETLLAMRRIVYDNDFPARDLVNVQPPRWADRDSGTGWASDGKNDFRLAAADAAGRWLRYNHLLRDDKLEFDVWRTKFQAMLKDPRVAAQVKEKVRAALGIDVDPNDLLQDSLSGDVRVIRDVALPREALLEDLRRAYTPEKPQLITDFMAYNSAETGHHQGSSSGVNWASDLILECDVQADQPQGELTLELSKGVDRFQARFDLATGACALYRGGDDKPLASSPTALKGGGKHSVRFANVDQQLTVWVDGALPFDPKDTTYLPPTTEGPTEKNDLEPAGVGLKGVGGTVSGLRLWRDTYYTVAVDRNPMAADAGPGVNFADPATWGGLRHLPARTMYVQPGNYLCLGDNSPRSSDGRFWGLVPERLLLGKAVAVFYPLDRLERIR